MWKFFQRIFQRKAASTIDPRLKELWMSWLQSKRREQFRKDHRPRDAAIAAEWDKDLDFFWGEQWRPEQIADLRNTASSSPSDTL